MHKSIFLILTILIVISSCSNKSNNGKNDDQTNVDNGSKTDTIIVVGPTEIIKAPRFIGPNWLYANCLNELSFDVSEVYSDFKIEIIDGTAIQSNENSGKWNVSPTGRNKCTIKGIAQSAGNHYEWLEEFNIIEPPRPQIEMVVNGKLYNVMTAIPKASRIAVKIVPDSLFKNYFPKDANYGIESIDVFAQLSLGAPEKVNTILSAKSGNSIIITLGRQIQQVRPGTVVYIRLNNIFRINHMGQTVEDNRFSETERTFHMVIK